MIDRQKFFKNIKPGLFKTLKQSQVDGMNIILDEWEANRDKLRDLRWLAYMFATTYHETAFTMEPIEEYGKGKGRPYGSFQKHSGIAYTRPVKLYYGRGYVMLTWYENYELMGRLLRLDLLNYPELLLKPQFAVKVMFEGMLRGSSSFGDFTGRCLEQYFNDTKDDPIGARKVINGTDKAEEIAGYHKLFLAALS